MTVYAEKPKNDSTAYELADVGTRLVALIIDSMILGVIAGILFVGTRNGGGLIGGMIVGIAYHWYFLTQQDGQTLGKRLMGIRVVKKTGEPLTAADAIVRYLGYYLNSAIFGLGWFWALFDSNRQGWHDMIAGTYVVKA